jgi:NAD-dependent SIR2 family protein deacetylase
MICGLIIENRKILFLGELQSKVGYDCDECHKNKLLEYLAMDEKNNLLTVCKECGESLRKVMDPA